MSTRPKPQARSRILQAVHETATDLQRLGFIDKRKQQKLAVLKTAAFFEERRQKSTGKALDALLSRTTGEPPLEGDELPEGYEPLAKRAAPGPAKPARRVRKAAQPAGATGKPCRQSRTYCQKECPAERAAAGWSTGKLPAHGLLRRVG
jgi:hypothetical protein